MKGNDLSPAWSPALDGGSDQGRSKAGKERLQECVMLKSTLTFSKANILTVKLKWNLHFFTGDREKDCILEFVLL